MNEDGNLWFLNQYLDDYDAPSEEDEQADYDLREQMAEAAYEDGEDF